MLSRLIVLFATLFLVVACAGDTDAPPPVTNAQNATAPVSPSNADDYRLGAEDKVKVTVFGEPDLSGEFVVDSSGVLAAPFLGQILVKGMTLRELEAAYGGKLRDAQILRDPRVNAEVTSFRPIYVLGEVKKPGQYAYVSGMTVQKAVALAEGYTYRASESTVDITRGGRKLTLDVTPQTKVLPGDEIRIPERFF
ncbi:MAG: polysaccharide export protein [Alphaproteobacteria bacterium]|nr:polysaccharide export protein [Alphaproteobacteria bacterium]